MNYSRLWTALCSTALCSTVATLGCENDEARRSPNAIDQVTRPSTTATSRLGTAPAMTNDRAPHQAGATGTHPVGGTMPGSTAGAAATAGATDGDKHEAEADFKSAPQMKVDGDAELEEVAGGVKIKIEVENAPTGQKGIHIHEKDDCSDIPNKSMGEHFAPTMPKHGLPGSAEHHLGDLGNITIDKDGNGKLEITVAGANLKAGDPLSFLGKSIVLHESSDKGTGASGDSGKPIACAPIRAD